MSGSGEATPQRTRMADQAYQQIRDAIVRVDLKPGEPLDEKSLSASLSLGLTPIRDALKRLSWERLATTYPRRGTFVSRIDIADEARLTEVRVELEGLAAALAAERATAAQISELQRLMTDLERGSLQRADHTDLDLKVHRAIYSAARNEYLETTLAMYVNLTMRIWNSCLRYEHASTVHIVSQRTVVDAIADRDAAGARVAAEKHLRVFSDEVRSTLSRAQEN
ncbi:MAG: GntR family transcriptional regulator [Actinomycetales bacterium]